MMNTKFVVAALAVATMGSGAWQPAAAGIASTNLYHYEGHVTVAVPDWLLSTTMSGSFFGFTTPGVYSASFSFDVDTTGATYIPAGQTLGFATTFSTDLYGVDASRIANFQASFGSRTWTAADLQSRGLAGPTPAANIWFAPDIANATAIRFAVNAGGDFFELGAPTCIVPNDCYLRGNIATFYDDALFHTEATGFTIRALDVAAAVPEPGSLLLIALGLAGLAGVRRTLSYPRR